MILDVVGLVVNGSFFSLFFFHVSFLEFMVVMLNFFDSQPRKETETETEVETEAEAERQRQSE